VLDCSLRPSEEHAVSIAANWPGGFYCPCRSSEFDRAGWVFKNIPAPTNLTVPPYTMTGSSSLLVGEDIKA
jgi:ubiquinol-cytochrome c reductase iron-sulfur subunit